MRGLAFAWIAVDALRGTPAEAAASVVTLAGACFARPITELGMLDGDARIRMARFRHGNLDLQGLVVRPPEARYGAEYGSSRVEICRLAERVLRHALNVPGGTELACELRAWSDRIQPADATRLPPDLAESLPSFHHEWLADEPFSPPLPPFPPGKAP